jgi:hypothetical protein
MRGATPSVPNTPSWRDAYLKHGDNLKMKLLALRKMAGLNNINRPLFAPVSSGGTVTRLICLLH